MGSLDSLYIVLIKTVLTRNFLNFPEISEDWNEFSRGKLTKSVITTLNMVFLLSYSLSLQPQCTEK